MTERVVPIDLDVRWEPNAPEAVLVVTDLGVARLTLEPHPDDPDRPPVVLTWLRVVASRFGPYNDEGIHHHPLWAAGLRDVLWAGEVLDSSWMTAVSGAVYMAPAHHFVVRTKEAVVEVLADAMTLN